MESKETCIDWLLQELPKVYFEHQQIVIQQAKELHKQEIIDAYKKGQESTYKIT